MAQVTREQPAVVLLDLLMPDVDGFAVVEQLRADPSTADVPIVVLTSKEMTRADRERLTGQISYLARKGTFGGKQLVDLVGHVCGRRPPRGDAMTATQLVLIVEDNDRNLKLARDVLDHVGYATLEARNGEEAVELARTHRPDLVLMDIQLPGMDGVEALARLRADPATAAIPVVALTAFAMKDDRERFLAAGFDGYLEKPINVREFPSQVAALLASARAGART